MNSHDNKFDVPHLNLSISDSDDTSCILKTVGFVRPKWDISKIQFKLLTDGITNKLVLCSNPSNEGGEDNVLVRIYGNKTDLLIDRKAEIRNIKLLHTCDLAPSLYATFENGLVYEYIPGNTISSEDVTRPEMYKLVAVEMAKMHKVKDTNAQKREPCLWSKLQQFFDLIPEEFEDSAKQKQYSKLDFTKAQLLQEIRDLRESINDLDIPVVFAHNDLLLGNIIYNKTKNKVYFIDFEYAGYNYQPYDIANHFAEFAGVNEVDYNKYPSRELQLDWLRTYLMEYKGVPCIDESEVEKLYVQVNKFVLATHLLWYAWSLIQAAFSHIEFDFIGYADLRLKEYFKKKSPCSANDKVTK